LPYCATLHWNSTGLRLRRHGMAVDVAHARSIPVCLLLCVSGLLGCWLGLCTYTRVQHTLCTLGAAVMLLVPSFRVCAPTCVRYRLICNLSASCRADMPVCCLRSCVQLAYITLDPLCCHVLSCAFRAAGIDQHGCLRHVELASLFAADVLARSTCGPLCWCFRS
jgi:hypothetical protein